MSFLKIFLTEATEAAEQGQVGMFDDMLDMFDILMLLLLLGIGFYGLYSAIRLRKEQLLFPNKFLYPGSCQPEECLDAGEFIDYITPRAIILSVLLLVIGALFALNAFVLHIDSWMIDLAMLIVPVGLLAWYGVIQRKAAKRFW